MSRVISVSFRQRASESGKVSAISLISVTNEAISIALFRSGSGRDASVWKSCYQLRRRDEPVRSVQGLVTIHRSCSPPLQPHEPGSPERGSVDFGFLWCLVRLSSVRE